MTFFSANSWCQINRDTLIGKYLYQDAIGGGFTGGPNGACMAVPPDCTIDNIITIDSNLVVIKVSDTTQHSGMYFDWGCDTLYMGRAEIIADTVVVTYTMKRICPAYYSAKTKKRERYKKLKHPVIEKYTVRIVDGNFVGLTRSRENGWEEYSRKSVIRTVTKIETLNTPR
jgi:hypothetical protein